MMHNTNLRAWRARLGRTVMCDRRWSLNQELGLRLFMRIARDIIILNG